MATKKHKFNKDIEDKIGAKIIDSELGTAERNKQYEVDEFESFVNLLDSDREAKDYDWMSDVSLPEFISRTLTQASMDANQYFQTRDFVEVFIEDEGDEALAAAEASKELINRTLNQKHLYHYMKYMRGKLINNLSGRVYAKCWWEKKTIEEVVGYEEVEDDIDIEGTPMSESTLQIAATKQVPITKERTVIDRFNYDIVDPRNVFLDNKYTYSLQEKDWITFRTEKTYEDLLADAEDMGYFNLHLVKDMKKPIETETSKKSHNSTRDMSKRYEKENKPVNEYIDINERFGKYWVKVLATNEEGYPTEIAPGIDKDGEVLPDAKLIETIITFAVSGSSKVLIRFQPTPYIDSYGQPYKPTIRGLCYIHPTDDGGIGDGKNAREIQLAIDDTFNISNDRVMLATLPTLVVNKNEAEDNPDIYIEPGHKIPLNDPDKGLKELGISDNIAGGLAQIQLLQGAMDNVLAVFPTTMGGIPGESSTSATAVAEGGQKSDIRHNYKSLTFENTFLSEMYNMIQQMTWVFAHPETGVRLMGDKVYDFDPNKDYFYKPVSQSIEPEHSKINKIKQWTQILGYVINIGHPDTPKLVNYILTQVFKYSGDEFVNFGNNLLNPEVPMMQGGTNTDNAQGAATNQTGLPISPQEGAIRNV